MTHAPDAVPIPVHAAAMASRWRRRALCRLDGAPAALCAITATGAAVQTALRPQLGAAMTLDHPEAGRIAGEVIAIERGLVRLALAGDERAVGFALAAIAADMSVP